MTSYVPLAVELRTERTITNFFEGAAEAGLLDPVLLSTFLDQLDRRVLIFDHNSWFGTVKTISWTTLSPPATLETHCVRQVVAL